MLLEGLGRSTPQPGPLEHRGGVAPLDETSAVGSGARPPPASPASLAHGPTGSHPPRTDASRHTDPTRTASTTSRGADRGHRTEFPDDPLEVTRCRRPARPATGSGFGHRRRRSDGRRRGPRWTPWSPSTCSRGSASSSSTTRVHADPGGLARRGGRGLVRGPSRRRAEIHLGPHVGVGAGDLVPVVAPGVTRS